MGAVNKRIVIKVGEGSLQTGYATTVQIGEENLPPQAETQARLPPAPELHVLYQQWQLAYRRLGGLLSSGYRLEAQDGVTNVSDFSDKARCQQLSQRLRDYVHHWLNGEDFRPIREKVLEQLSPQDTSRILLQTSDPLLLRLPWYELHFFQRYRQAEVGICLPHYQQVSYRGSRSAKVRVLAVIGDAAGLDTHTDCELLQQLPDAEVHFLPEPDVDTFNQRLWDEKGWDILFFAGHSRSHQHCMPDIAAEEETIGTEARGEILLNATDRLTVKQLKHALSKAIDRGLNTAIFNSCDGLGLATDLADLHIPQVLVMREPVPDRVAHRFLQGFLTSFSAGRPFYVAVREAREKLQGLESQFPCATWLPVIVQNLAETPPTWRSLQGKPETSPSKHPDKSVVSPEKNLPAKPLEPVTRAHWQRAFVAGMGVFATVFGLRLVGGLERLELKAYDYLLRSRPTESLDDRLLIITNTEADVVANPNTQNNRSISDSTLSDVLTKLEDLDPQLIGLDIYLQGEIQTPKLAQQVKETDRLMTICKVSDHTTNTPATPPPPDIENIDRIGASDFVTDDHGDVLRRHLLALLPPADSVCQVYPTFSLAIVNRYLREAHNIAENEGEQIGVAQLSPVRERTFGSYHNADSTGSQLMLNYRILREPEQTGCDGVIETPADCISVGDFLSGSVDGLRSRIEGKIILIGTTANGFGDSWLTPYTQASSIDRQVPGVFLQAQMISQLVSAALGERSFISSWADWQEGLWTLGWAMVGGAVGLSQKAWKVWLRLLLAEGLLVLGCWLLLAEGNVWVPWVPSAIALPTAAVTTQQVSKIRSALSKVSSS